MSSVNKFLDGTDLNNSTAVYDEASLTTKASDGYYSNGTIVREQVNGLLLPAASCPACVDPYHVQVQHHSHVEIQEFTNLALMLVIRI